jgi:hypothetical protein
MICKGSVWTVISKVPVGYGTVSLSGPTEKENRNRIIQKYGKVSNQKRVNFYG